jgi:hypothetical protein
MRLIGQKRVEDEENYIICVLHPIMFQPELASYSECPGLEKRLIKPP